MTLSRGLCIISVLLSVCIHERPSVKWDNGVPDDAFQEILFFSYKSKIIMLALGAYSDNTITSSARIDPVCYHRPCGEDETCFPGKTTRDPSRPYSCLKLTLDEPSCSVDSDCEHIKGICYDQMCRCKKDSAYNKEELTCYKACEDDWIWFDRKCYFFGTWPLAHSIAEDIGSTCTKSARMDKKDGLQLMRVSRFQIGSTMNLMIEMKRYTSFNVAHLFVGRVGPTKYVKIMERRFCVKGWPRICYPNKD